jgi:hypothetical protein
MSIVKHYTVGKFYEIKFYGTRNDFTISKFMGYSSRHNMEFNANQTTGFFLKKKPGYPIT